VRVLLDEQLPVDLAEVLTGHTVDTVVGRGWAGVKNGDLLQRMRGEYDALVTMDQGIGFQQNVSGLPFGVLLLRASSNRLLHLRPLVPSILDALSRLSLGQLSRLGV
jgi:predicted nuclease of predicted toxin-antitoxin system